MNECVIRILLKAIKRLHFELGGHNGRIFALHMKRLRSSKLAELKNGQTSRPKISTSLKNLKPLPLIKALAFSTTSYQISGLKALERSVPHLKE